MSKIKIAAVTVLVVAVVAPLVIQYQTNTRLREENDSLGAQTAQLDELKNLRAETERLFQSQAATNNAQLQELLRLRGQAASWRAREAELVQLQAENRQLKSPAPKAPAIATDVPRVAAETWANVGFATPAAAFQTVNWAMTHHYTNVLASALVWPDVQTKMKAEAAFAATPESVRARYGSLDELIYSSYMGGFMGMSTATGFRILNQVDQGNRSILSAQRDLADGRSTMDKATFQSDGTSYKQVIVPGIVDRMIQSVQQPTPSGRP